MGGCSHSPRGKKVGLSLAGSGRWLVGDIWERFTKHKVGIFFFNAMPNPRECQKYWKKGFFRFALLNTIVCAVSEMVEHGIT